jgi:hypothetical protein
MAMTGKIVVAAFMQIIHDDKTCVADGSYVLTTFRPPRNPDAIQDPAYYLKGIESGVKILPRKVGMRIFFCCVGLSHISYI